MHRENNVKYKTKLKTGDTVLVRTGKCKGQSGKITKVLLAKNKAIVEGINLIKKHTKPNPNVNQAGGIIEKEAAIHLSNLAIMNPNTNKAEKMSLKILADGKKVRVFRSNGEQVDI